MKKIFAIICHKVNNPLIFTVNYLSRFDENIVLIHVDKKSDVGDFIFLKKNNVHFVEDRVDVVWGGVSQIEATIKLMKKSIELKFDYFYLLSGNDIPIKSNEHMNFFLKKNEGMNFIHFQDERNKEVNALLRVKYSYPPVFYDRNPGFFKKIYKKILLLNPDLLMPNFQYSMNRDNMPALYKGTNWFTLKFRAVEYIINYIKNNPWYFEVFKHSLCGDEVFFHSIFMTAKGESKYTNKSECNDALRYIDWSSGPDYPKKLSWDDLPRIHRSEAHFARKINDIESLDFINSIFNSKQNNDSY